MRMTLPLKVLLPAKVLLLLKSVEEAAEMVIELPTLNADPLIVPRDPVRRFVPIDDVETSLPLASVPRSDEVTLGSHSVPKVASDEDEF